MQRRVTQRSSSKASSLPYTSSPYNQQYSSKKKGRKITPLQLIIYCVIALVSLTMLLTPTQKQELVQAEQKVEEWVHKATANQNDPKYTPKIKNQKDDEEPLNEEKEEDYVMHPELHPEKEKEWEEAYVHPHQKTEEDHQTAQQSPRHNPPPSRWVDGEKELKKKLKVLYDQQNKDGTNLAAPVLTRYLGEDIPAFVGTPDSKMEPEEWKKLVEEKYAEMREEEEAWQKKMAEFVKQKDRDIGITTP